jgi:hypothetical protein
MVTVDGQSIRHHSMRGYNVFVMLFEGFDNRLPVDLSACCHIELRDVYISAAEGTRGTFAV